MICILERQVQSNTMHDLSVAYNGGIHFAM